MPFKTSRRDFLSAGLMVPVAGAASNIGFLQTPAAKPATLPVKLDYRTLGHTGLKVTAVGFGCMITSDPSVIQRAADLGVNYFDTARGYQHGNNERMVGSALASKRKELVISTKSHSPDKASVLKDLDTSLAELKTDYVDIWYLHAKDKPEDIHDDLIEAQQIARQQGKIRFAGMSTHALPRMSEWTVEKKAFDVVLTVCNFSMDSKMDEAIAAVARTGTGVVAMKVMAGGFRDVKPTDPLYGKLERDGAMLAALKWVLKKPNIATTIPSMTDMDQLDENLRAMSEPFSSGDEKILAAHLEKIRPLYCRICGECDGACRQGLRVADTLRILTYAEGYRQFALARERFRELPTEHAVARCTDCDACTVHCPHGVHVAERMGTRTGTFRMRPALLLLAMLLTAAAGSAQAYLDCHFVPGWEQSGPKRAYTADNLFDYRDGAAEGYLIFGFVRMQGIDCKSGAVTLAIDISEMADADSAYGMFAANRDIAHPISKIGMGAQVSPQSLLFAKGRYFVEVVETDGSSNADQSVHLQAFAAKMEPLLEGRAEPPDVLQWFPTEDKVSVRLVPESVLGLRILKRGYVAKYKEGQAFVVIEDSPESAAVVMKKLRERYSGSAPAQLGDEAFQAQVPYLDGICIFRKGRYIGGYTNLSNSVQATTRAETLLQRIP